MSPSAFLVLSLSIMSNRRQELKICGGEMASHSLNPAKVLSICFS